MWSFVRRRLEHKKKAIEAILVLSEGFVALKGCGDVFWHLGPCMVLLRALRGHSLHHTLPSKTKTYLSQANTLPALKEISSWYNTGGGLCGVTFATFLLQVQNSYFYIYIYKSLDIQIVHVARRFKVQVWVESEFRMIYFSFVALVINPPIKLWKPYGLHLITSFLFCFFFQGISFISIYLHTGRSQCDKGQTIPHYPPPMLPSLPCFLFPFFPLLPLFAALLTTVTAALIMPLWSPRVAGMCHLLPRGAWVITGIHPRAGAPVPWLPWR